MSWFNEERCVFAFARAAGSDIELVSIEVSAPETRTLRATYIVAGQPGRMFYCEGREAGDSWDVARRLGEIAKSRDHKVRF